MNDPGDGTRTPGARRWVRRTLVIGLLLAFAVVAFDLWRRTTTTTVWERSDGQSMLTRIEQSLWSDEVALRETWSIGTGYLVHRVRTVEEGQIVTIWDTSGELLTQLLVAKTTKKVEQRTGPPWFEPVEDQVVPSAPWLAEGLTAEEWWERVDGASFWLRRSE